MRTAALSLMTTLAVMVIATNNANAEISWQTNLRAAHAQAQREGKLLLLHFYTDNCTWCAQLEEGSFKAPAVGEAISQSFVPVKIHANTSPKLVEMFNVTRFPTDVIVTTDGKTLSHSVSPQSPERYVVMLSETLPALTAGPSPQTASLAANRPPAAAAPAVDSAAETTTQTAPAYAIAATADPVAQTQPSTVTPPSEGLTLPTTDLHGGVKAQFAGSRSEGESLSLQMPEQAKAATPQIDTEVAKIEQPPATVEPELAMQGFCPVTVINEDKWVEGKPEFGAIHLGKLYLFTSEENLKTFLADPVPYTPVLNEIDVVRFFEERKIVPGKREWGLKDPIHNRMFFFADEAAMNHFYNEYERYTDVAIEVMEKAVKDANPGT